MGNELARLLLNECFSVLRLRPSASAILRRQTGVSKLPSKKLRHCCFVAIANLGPNGWFTIGAPDSTSALHSACGLRQQLSSKVHSVCSCDQPNALEISKAVGHDNSIPIYGEVYCISV